MIRNSIKAFRTVISHNPGTSNLCSKGFPIRQYHSCVKRNTQCKWQDIAANHLSIPYIMPCYKRNVHVVLMRGLDWEAKDQDVVDFFKPLNIIPTQIHMKCDISGRVTGLCEVEFATHAEAVVAMRKKNAFIGNRFIRLSIKSSDSPKEEPDSPKEELPGNDDKSSSLSSKSFTDIDGLDRKLFPTGHFIRMRNLPTRMTEQAIFQFFWPLNVKPTSVQPVHDENGYRTGEFDVEFLSHGDAVKAMSKNNSSIGHMFVELILYSDVNPVPRPSLFEESRDPMRDHEQAKV